jgi:hypothetical protein
MKLLGLGFVYYYYVHDDQMFDATFCVLVLNDVNVK